MVHRSDSRPGCGWIGLAVLLVGCATTIPSPEAGSPGKMSHAPVVGEAFLRGENRTLLAEEVCLELPLHLESEVFLAGNRTHRWEKNGKKMKEALGMARVKFGEGLEIREAHRILIAFSPAGNTIRLTARGHIVFIDLAMKRVVREATALEVQGKTVLFHGPYKDEMLK